MADSKVRFGILGTAGIARKNWAAMKLSGSAAVAAVASRSTESAERFIRECSSQVPPDQAPAAIGSYDALLERDDIDAVYIPLPTALRHEWVIKAAEAGKHVIGEKPAALNAAQVDEMLAACKSNSVQYMDGVMFMHSKRPPLVKHQIESGEIGTLRRLTSQFSFAGDEEFQKSNIRAHSGLEPHGCLGDLGWYCIRYFMLLMNGEMPLQVSARTLSTLRAEGSPGTVPGQFTADLTFRSGVTAAFYCSFITENQQWVHASGDQGNLRVDDFVLPYHRPEVAFTVTKDRFDVDNCEFHMENHQTRHSVREYDSNHATAQEANLIRNFCSIVQSGSIDPSWAKWTLDTQKVLDACFNSSQQDGAPITLQ